jgi:histidinol-phosphate phosphatase family protein
MPAMFTQAVQHINSENPDLVVVTGDLLDYPLYALRDNTTQQRAIEDLHLVRKPLDDLDCPYVIIHGNHDHPDLVQSVFSDISDEMVVAGHRVVTFHDYEADFHIPQRLGDEREKFLRVLEQTDLPQIHVQHYLVWPQMSEGYPHSYREARSMRDQIVDSETVRLVLSGHYHRGIGPLRERDTWFSATPSFGEPPHRYRMYELDGTDLSHRDHSIVAHTESTQQSPKPAVFLDRDGTINPQPAYHWGPERMELLPGAANAIKRLKDAGYPVVIVSNQTCVGYGYVTADEAGAVMDRMSELLQEEAGIDIDGVYMCHEAPTAVLPEYRHNDPPDLKPNPGMLTRAADELGFDLATSYMVGDSLTDLGAGHRVGTKSILVRTGHGAQAESELPSGLADYVASDLVEAVDWILRPR